MKPFYDRDGTRAALIEEWYRIGLYGKESIPEALALGARRYAKKRMIFYANGQVQSFKVGDLYKQSLGLAGAMHSIGLRSGNLVAIQVPNRIEGYLIFQAALLARLKILPIVHIYGAAEVGYLLRESGARALFVPDKWRKIDYIEPLAGLDHLPDLEFRVVIGEDVPRGSISWETLNSHTTLDFPRSKPNADDPVILLFTSGTTANPKGALHSHNSLLAELKSGTQEEGVNLSPWPAGHIAGVLGILRLYFSGTESVLMDTWDPGAAAELIERFQVTSTSGTPYHVHSLLDAAKQESRDISSLNYYMVGAAAVPKEVVELCEQTGFKTVRAYGSTEHPTITSGVPEDSLVQRASTDGRPEEGCRIRIVGEDGVELPVGAAGEVISQGPDQFLGYHRDEHNEAAFAPGGWFKTGDIGRLDHQGFLTITDRKKDIIIRGGENISSKEVEDYLVSHPLVREAAVVAIPHERLGEQVYAYLIPDRGAEITMNDIESHFRALGVARQKTPQFIEQVADLPRTPTGKVKKFELRKRLLSG